MRFLRQNTWLKVLSLVLAVVLWGIVRITGAPSGEIPAQQVFRLPIRITNPEQPDLVAEPALKEVTLTLRGKRSVIDKVRPALIQADVDLGDRGPGNYLERVNVLAPGGVEVVEVEPSHVGVKISRRLTAQVPVRIRLEGDPAAGYDAAEAVVEPRSVKVYGPEDDVEQVVAVTGTLKVADRKRTLTTDVAREALLPVNSSGVVVGGVRIQDEAVAVTVPVQFANLNYQVPVVGSNVQIRKQPGWEYDVRIEPQLVTLSGPPGSEPPSQVATEPLGFGNVHGPQTKEAEVVVPEGFSVVGTSVVKVTVTSRRPSSASSRPAQTGQAN